MYSAPYISKENFQKYYDEKADMWLNSTLDNFKDWRRSKQKRKSIAHKINKDMRKILTVKELITLLLEHNMDANVYVNVDGIPTGLTLPNICWDGHVEGCTKKEATMVTLDIQEEEK